MLGACIVGASKTGTTGLYSSVKAGLLASGATVYSQHEQYDPTAYRNLQRLAPDVPVVSKMLITNAGFSEAIVRRFEKRVMIVRDPRDTLLSAVLYYPVLAVNRDVPEEQINEYINLVREKEADPSSHSFLELIIEVYRLIGRSGVDSTTDFGRRYRLTIDTHASLDSHLVRYENFVRDELGDLASYLGYPVRNVKPSSYGDIVVRSAGYGEWRDWFLPSDVKHFRPIMQEYMSVFGYEDEWDLAANQHPSPQTGSEYIERSCARRRRQRELNQSQESTEERRRQLRSRANDGASNAAYHLAVEFLERSPGQDGAEARELLGFSAACGHIRAMRRLAEVLRTDVGGRPDLVQGDRWEAEAEAENERRRLQKRWAQHKAAAGTTDREATLREQLESVEDALAQVYDSKRYRAGNAIVESLNGSWRARAQLPRVLWRIARS